jgi:CHAT domain-containing protein
MVESLADADIVHFGGHGYTNLQNGALLFAPRHSRAADYELLQSSDLRRQDWSRCRLAVLSACATAAGETRGTHDPDSLVRALTKAGVQRVAATLWSVDSTATTELMKEFYAALGRGEGPAQALRIAQRQIKRLGPAWDHPYYWSGFQLYGTV